jgi:hypothetical protein
MQTGCPSGSHANQANVGSVRLWLCAVQLPPVGHSAPRGLLAGNVHGAPVGWQQQQKHSIGHQQSA